VVKIVNNRTDHGRKTSQLSSFIPQTRKHKIKTTPNLELDFAPKGKGKKDQRQSPRLLEKTSKRKSIMKKAQELVARKCGILEEEQELDDMTLQKYLDMYKQPLNEESMQAIIKLTEVAGEKIKKKKKDKKKRETDEAKEEDARKQQNAEKKKNKKDNRNPKVSRIGGKV
jgi:hypothetical protein